MPGIDINILFSALFTLLGMAGSNGVVLFVGGRWTARIEDRLIAVEKHFCNVDRPFEDMDRRMTEGSAAVHQQFDDVNKRIDSLETRIASLEKRVSHLDVRIGKIPEVTIYRSLSCSNCEKR